MKAGPSSPFQKEPLAPFPSWLTGFHKHSGIREWKESDVSPSGDGRPALPCYSLGVRDDQGQRRLTHESCFNKISDRSSCGEPANKSRLGEACCAENRRKKEQRFKRWFSIRLSPGT